MSCGIEKGRRETVEGSPKGWLGYWVKIKMFQLFVGGLRKCADFQVVRYCGKEGTKNPHRRIEEGKPPRIRREITEGLPINKASLSLPPEMPDMCHN